MNGKKRLPGEALSALRSRMTTRVVVTFLLLFGVSVVYFIVCAINFAEASFDFSRVKTPGYWINYITVISLGIMVMALIVFYKMYTLKGEGKVADIKTELRELKDFISGEGYGVGFKEYLGKLNRQRKLEVYKGRLCFLRDHTRKQARYDRYTELLERAEEDIDDLRVRYEEINETVLFDGIRTKKGVESYRYSGTTGLGTAIGPSLVFGMFLQCIVFSLVLSRKETSIDTWVNLTFTLCVMSMYMLRGISFATYNVNEVYYSVLCRRRGVVLDYFATIGLKLEINDNRNYKYLITATPQGADDAKEIENNERL